jgi:hypothetical protein
VRAKLDISETATGNGISGIRFSNAAESRRILEYYILMTADFTFLSSW